MTRFPLHPLLFAVLPVYSMFATNPGEGDPRELIASVRVVIAVAGLGWLASAAAFARRRYVLPLTYLLLAASALWLHRRRAAPLHLTGPANMLALGAVLPPVVRTMRRARIPWPRGT
jgi:hypothetical protein